ncbi:MAG: glycosyl transferase group 1 [Mucilaginibacter sp.]|nr:glycosyl transferase group 1 [Mucilaginibacter sp.]
MKLILVDHKDSSDINHFSGTSFFMKKAIEEEFEEVVGFSIIESIEDVKTVINSGVSAGLKPFGKKLTDFIRDNQIKSDFVLCQGGNTAVPYYKHATPIAYWHDSSWQTFLQGYKGQKSFEEFRFDYPNLYAWDKKAFDRADLLLFSSDYVAEACVKYYGIPAPKIRVIPFGANLQYWPDNDLMKRILQNRLKSSSLNFTFIGKDWKRKGLDNAFLLVKKLNWAGIASHLSIVGCEPEIKGIDNSPFVSHYGFLNKAISKDVKLIEDIMQNTHFLLHPAVSEPFGIVLCEANAYGIPVIGTRTEGLKTIVAEGQNGFLFNRSEFVKKAFDTILQLNINFNKNYTFLFESARAAFNQRLNWSSNVKELKNTLKEFIG